jgi:hypothetical protein
MIVISNSLESDDFDRVVGARNAKFVDDARAAKRLHGVPETGGAGDRRSAERRVGKDAEVEFQAETSAFCRIVWYAVSEQEWECLTAVVLGLAA